MHVWFTRILSHFQCCFLEKLLQSLAFLVLPGRYATYIMTISVVLGNVKPVLSRSIPSFGHNALAKMHATTLSSVSSVVTSLLSTRPPSASTTASWPWTPRRYQASSTPSRSRPSRTLTSCETLCALARTWDRKSRDVIMISWSRSGGNRAFCWIVGEKEIDFRTEESILVEESSYSMCQNISLRAGRHCSWAAEQWRGSGCDNTLGGWRQGGQS